MIGAGLVSWAIETLIATTLLMLLVLAIRGPVRRAFGPQIAYALWLLPVVRLLLPPIPEGWNEQAAAVAAPVAAASQIVTIYVVEPLGAAPGAGAEGSFGLWMALLAAWAAGTLGFLGYHLVSHSRFCRRLLARARVDRTVAGGRVRVIETDAAHGPLAFGIWRKYVAFPRDFSERYDAQERDLALAHELGHHVRGDLIANWVALVMLALHWFNPVAFKAFRAFRADQEMACDALVLAGRAQALRHAYGRAIVKSAHGGAVSAACHLHTINELKGRLRMLSKNNRKSPMRLAAGLVGVSALSLAALGLTASGTQAAERIKDKVEKTIGVSLTPPAAPRAPQDVPDLPEPPTAPELPDSYDAPPAPPEAPDAPRIHRDRKVVVLRNGEKIDVDVDVDAILADIPDIRDGKCGEGDGRDTVVHRSEGGRKVMIICTDRIEKMAADAERMAEKHARMGIRSAMGGLRAARASIEADRTLSAERKAEALRGIDEAMRELETESAGQD